ETDSREGSTGKAEHGEDDPPAPVPRRTLLRPPRPHERGDAEDDSGHQEVTREIGDDHAAQASPEGGAPGGPPKAGARCPARRVAYLAASGAFRRPTAPPPAPSCATPAPDANQFPPLL